MSIISVNASQNYNVIVGSNILTHIGEYVSDVHSNCKVAIISDSNVFPIYGKSVEISLQHAGFETIHFVFPAVPCSSASCGQIIRFTLLRS